MINKLQRHCIRKVAHIFKGLYYFISVYVLLSSIQPIVCKAHLIQFEHTGFHTSGFPRLHFSHTQNELSQDLSTKELTPSEYMVDLTNDLNYRILYYHSILNRNNFAFSPTALMSVLVAIYEGSAGRSMTELKNVLHLPNNRDIIRVGYRDIHRRLRTYFFNLDNPLKGLSLNKENVSITRDYDTILMFYGYDLGVDMVYSAPMPSTSTVIAAAIAEQTTISTTSIGTSTLSAIADAFKTENTTITATTVSSPPTIFSLESSTEISTTTTTTMEVTTSISEENVTIIKPEEIAANISAKGTEIDTAETATSNETLTTTEVIESALKSKADTDEAAELISSFIAEENSEPFSRIQKARVTRLPSAKLQAPLTFKNRPRVNYLPAQRKSKRLIRRNKRNLLGLKDIDSSLFLTLLNGESHLHNPLTTGSERTGLPTYVQLPNDFEVDTDFIATSHTSPNIKENYNTDVISHVFYLNNKHIIYTTFKVYNAVLYYKYFEHLRMSVLELELDTPEYNLFILLPDYTTDLVTAASLLRAGPKLRLMRKQLKPKWVQAIIPDFKLHGTMFLTNDLQNLGICDIFEPNRADFRPMTDEKGIYVNHIEQSINVHIRTKPINQLRRNNGADTQPIQISVNHPFIFFIIDRDMDVAVMAGRILNPLNVRVQ